MENTQIEKALQELKQKIEQVESAEKQIGEQSLSQALSDWRKERGRTNQILSAIAKRVSELEAELRAQVPKPAAEEIRLSGIDSKIMNFVGTSQMGVTAEEVTRFMSYKGKNAACARLKRLADRQLLSRIQVGHKVYYYYDAGKATKTLILSPPQ